MDIKIIKKLDEIIKNMVTKDDFKGELAKYATKDDLVGMKKELIERISEAQMEIVEVVHKHKADRVEVESLEKRVSTIEDQLHQSQPL